jgi:hypothetical protein
MGLRSGAAIAPVAPKVGRRAIAFKRGHTFL